MSTDATTAASQETSMQDQIKAYTRSWKDWERLTIMMIDLDRDGLAAMLHGSCGCGQRTPSPSSSALGCRIAYEQADLVLAKVSEKPQVAAEGSTYERGREAGRAEVLAVFERMWTDPDWRGHVSMNFTAAFDEEVGELETSEPRLSQ